MMNRREFCQTTAGLALTAVFASLMPLGRTLAQTVGAAELMQPNPLGEMALGDAKAPVTIIEYASLTCPHCAHFAATTWPTLKKDYVDKGKVRFIFREFPLDPLAAAGFMLARCAAKDDSEKYFVMIDTLFAQQKTWVVQQPLAPLKVIAKQAGLNEDQFNECLTNQKLVDGLEALRGRAAEKLGVNSTPTFFINGEKKAGDLSMEELTKAMEPYLKAG
ncbi:MAG: DsbA family protein [Pseudolabrys sp.]|nr:DsbA family protein [Pseudolabrys sp.]